MKDALRPRDAKDVEDAVFWALGESKTLEVAGRGTKRGIGRPSQSDLTLDLSGLSGVTLYEPEELVLSARAGTPLTEIEALVASKGQELAFEPMDYGPVLGVAPGAGTIGGALAANLAGPRRIKSGAARDHFLGTSAVSGRGETFKTGGRVVKNVTGYDLCKVLAGSFGTLAAMTDVSIKVLPKAETEQTVMVHALDDAAAMRAMAAAMNSSCDVSGAGHFPEKIAASLLPLPDSVTALRIEGVAPSVAHRKQMLEASLKSFGALSTIDETASRQFWRGVRDVLPFATEDAEAADVLWRVSTAPANGASLAAVVAAKADAQMFYDWAGGLVWIALQERGDDGGAALVRRAVATFGGHATLVRAPAALRATVDVFEPADAAVAALSRRVKQSFDPKGVLNPGRMWAGV
jgi:glycolate oxidase FAD binding subunit